MIVFFMMAISILLNKGPEYLKQFKEIGYMIIDLMKYLDEKQDKYTKK